MLVNKLFKHKIIITEYSEEQNGKLNQVSKLTTV